MKTLHIKHIVALSLAILMIMCVSSCSGTGLESAKTIELIDYLIYKDENGDLFYSQYSPSSYTHSLSNVHYFSDTIPQTFEGYTYSFNAERTTESGNASTKELEEKLTIITSDNASATYGKQLNILSYKSVYELLSENSIRSDITSYSYKYIDGNSSQVDGIGSWQSEFAVNDSLEKTFSLKFNYYTYDGQYTYTLSVHRHTYTFVQSITHTYSLPEDVYVEKIPYYNDKGEKVADLVKITSDHLNLTYMEY